MFQGQRSEGGGLVEASDATNIFCLYYFCNFFFGFLQNCLVFMFQGQSRQCGGWVEASDATNAAKLLGIILTNVSYFFTNIFHILTKKFRILTNILHVLI